jgi:hypothetical protein
VLVIECKYEAIALGVDQIRRIDFSFHGDPRIQQQFRELP